MIFLASLGMTISHIQKERSGRTAAALKQIRIILIEKHIARDYAKLVGADDSAISGIA